MAELSRLPGTNTDHWDWQMHAACRGEQSAVFFHPEGERGPARRKRDAAAKAVCATCPVLNQCREHGLAVREPYGVWGGLSEEEREAIYARVDSRHYPRHRGDGLRIAEHDIDAAVSPRALGIA